MAQRSGEADGATGTSGGRWRTALRRARRMAERFGGRAQVDGFVDGVIAGEIRGWAVDPARPFRRVHIVASCKGEVVAETLADQSRLDLVREGRGDGRHAFRLRLPSRLLDGQPHEVRVEALIRGRLVRLLKGEVTVQARSHDHSEAPVAGEAGAADPLHPAAARLGAQGRALLVIWGEASEADLRRTLAGWEAQNHPDRAVLRLGAPAAGLAGQPPGEGTALRRIFAEAHTVLFAPAGAEPAPGAAAALVRQRPLADVLTFDGDTPASRRPEARALGVLVGEDVRSLAVRGPVLAGSDLPLSELLAAPTPQRLALRLAGRAWLRWAHLPVRLLGAAAASEGRGIAQADAAGLEGFSWRPAAQGRAGRLVPERGAARITLAAWPAGASGARATLLKLLQQAPAEGEIEVLLPAGSEEVEAQLRALRPEGLRVRPVDAPPGAGAGQWLRALSEAAVGDCVILCHAGAMAELGEGGLQELAAWSLSPLVSAAAITLRPPWDGAYGGLGLERTADGWRAGLQLSLGGSRPVLAAPSAFMAVARERIATAGGFDDLRFPGEGADLDFALRLRRGGASGLLLHGLAVEAPAPGEIPPETFAAWDAAELAGAAAAYGPPEERGA